MAGQRTRFQSVQSTAGVALAGMGMFLLYAHLTAGVVRFSHELATGSSKVLALLLVVSPEVSQVLRTYGADQQRFLQHMLVSCWPLVLVVVGTALARDSFSDNASELANKNNFAGVDLTNRRSTSKWRS
jgi:putative effector of murein hydrolase LrgA (UPF0299 family)